MSPSKSQHGYADVKEKHAKHLARIEGQVRGVKQMIDDDRYCIDILTQIAAVNKSLHSVATELLETHIGHCVMRAAEGTSDEKNASIAEATDAVKRMLRV